MSESTAPAAAPILPSPGTIHDPDEPEGPLAAPRSSKPLRPAKLALTGYAIYVGIGWILLSLPWCQRETGVSALDNLFIATSAVSTTGLVTVSVSDQYTRLGQGVVLLLIQLGGLGYMTLGSFLVLARSASLSATREQVGRTVFALPESFRIDKFIRSVILFTLVIEAAGAVALYFLFAQRGVADAGWSAVFHSVSAFCTAGFGLYNDSFESYRADFWINAVLAALSYLGAIGFIVCVDGWRMLRGKVDRMTLTSKIIISATIWLSVGGTLLIFLTEPSIRDLPVHERWLASSFQAMTAITTVGFNTIPIGGVSRATVLLIVVLMIIGASPSGTGGGVKSTTVSAMLGVMASALRGDREVRFRRRPIPIERLWTAAATLGFYVITLLTGAYLLQLTETSSFEATFFEAASALGTVGLSTGITASLTPLGKVTIILLMFCGRVGPLTLGAAILGRPPAELDPSDSDLAV
jgi:trk system potassium uptake protein TrkH